MIAVFKQTHNRTRKSKYFARNTLKSVNVGNKYHRNGFVVEVVQTNTIVGDVRPLDWDTATAIAYNLNRTGGREG